MISKTTNIFAAAIYEELNDMVGSYVGTETENSTKESFINEDGNILIPLNNNTFENEVFTDYKIYDSDNDDEFNDEDEDRDRETQLNGGEYYDIFNDIRTEDILKIPATKDVLQDILIEMFRTKDSSIYGITVIDDMGRRYNVLHPITAHMIKTGEIVLSEMITIIVYSYKDEQYVSEHDSFINKISSIIKLITNNGYKSKSAISFERDENTDFKFISESGNFMNIDLDFKETGGARPQFGLIPVQFMTSEVAYPYYGIVASETDGMAYMSRNLTGMASGNIGIEPYNTEGRFSTCTGEEPNDAFNSLFTLNDMNLHSLYDEHVLNIDWKTWVFTCQMYSIYELYSEEIDVHQIQWREDELAKQQAEHEAVLAEELARKTRENQARLEREMRNSVAGDTTIERYANGRVAREMQRQTFHIDNGHTSMDLAQATEPIHETVQISSENPYGLPTMNTIPTDFTPFVEIPITAQSNIDLMEETNANIIAEVNPSIIDELNESQSELEQLTQQPTGTQGTDNGE